MRSRLAYLAAALAGIGLVATVAGSGILLASSRADVAAWRRLAPLDAEVFGALPVAVALHWAASWAVGVVAALAALWPALVRARAAGHAWLPFWLGCAAVLGWAGAAFLPRDGWFAPWPGPNEPSYASRGTSALTMLHPAATWPLLIVGGLALATWLARWSPAAAGAAHPPGAGSSLPIAPSRAGRWAARVIVGVPSVALLGVGLAGSVAVSADPYAPLWQTVPVGPMLGLAGLVGLTGVAAHEGRWAIFPLAFAYLVMFSEPIVEWWRGGSYWLLASAAATLAAMTGAWLLRPAARAFDDLTA